MDSSLAAFRDQANNWKPYFAARARVVLAIREEGRWRLWYSYTAFLPSMPDNFEHCDIQTQSVRAFRDLLQLEDARAAAEIVSEALGAPGHIESAGVEFELSPGLQNLAYEYEPLHLNRFAGPSRLPALSVRSFNSNYRPFVGVQELDQELQTAQTPYDGFADLASVLGIPVSFDELNRQRLSELVLIPPVQLQFDALESLRCELVTGKLSLVMRAHTMFPVEKIKVGIKAFRQKEPPKRYALEKAVRRSSDTPSILCLEHDLAVADCPLVQVFLSSDDELIGKWWLRDFGSSFNDRMLLHRSIDPTDQLKATFYERPEQFEDKAQLVLTLLGLTALKYGKILTSGPDILAISASRHVYVVECTTGDINNRGKLQRLNDRTKVIRERLNNSGNPPVGVVSVMFTSLARADTTMHWDTAATFQIAIVARENISVLLDMLDAPFSPDQIYSNVLSLIPSKDMRAPGEPAIDS